MKQSTLGIFCQQGVFLFQMMMNLRESLATGDYFTRVGTAQWMKDILGPEQEKNYFMCHAWVALILIC